MQENNYQVFRNDLGDVDAINRLSDGATVPTWDDADPITIAFQEWLIDHPEFDISDHQITSEPETTQPKWDEFRSRMMSHPTMGRVATNPLNSFYYPPLVAAMWQLGGNPSVLSDIATLWGAMIANAPLQPEEISDLAKIVVDCDMRFELSETGAIAVNRGLQS